jgi:hypothetical protein
VDIRTISPMARVATCTESGLSSSFCRRDAKVP